MQFRVEYKGNNRWDLWDRLKETDNWRFVGGFYSWRRCRDAQDELVDLWALANGKDRP